MEWTVAGVKTRAMIQVTMTVAVVVVVVVAVGPHEGEAGQGAGVEGERPVTVRPPRLAVVARRRQRRGEHGEESPKLGQRINVTIKTMMVMIKPTLHHHHHHVPNDLDLRRPRRQWTKNQAKLQYVNATNRQLN